MKKSDQKEKVGEKAKSCLDLRKTPRSKNQIGLKS